MTVAQDLRFAFRTLRRSPIFTLVALFSLAIGIGANTAIFSLVDQLLLRLLPVRDPEQLVMIWSTGPHAGSNRGDRAASYPMYQDFQQRAEAFSFVFARYSTDLAVAADNQTQRVNGELVSGNYFQALGVKPAAGRLFTPAEDDTTYKGHPVAVLSHAYWTTRFAANHGVIGKKILVNNYPVTVVGVTAAGFNGLSPVTAPHIFIPIQMKPLMTPGWDSIGDRRSQWIQMFARMKPGFTLERAKASLQPLFHQILEMELKEPGMQAASQYQKDRFLARQVRMEQAGTGYSGNRQSYGTALIVLMAMVGLVLLIVCFNVANLLIARAMVRSKEVAMRLAVGASRAQLIWQLLIESLVLSAGGGIAGVALSYWIIQALLRFLPVEGATLILSPVPNPRILAFNLGIAILTAVLFGLFPAMKSTRLDLWTTLKDAAAAVTRAGSSVRWRKALVMAQVGLSFLLLAGSALFVRTLQNLKDKNTGFRNMENLVTFQMDPSQNGYDADRLRNFYPRLLEAVRTVPGVTDAGIAAVPLLHGFEWDSGVSVEGHQNKDGEDVQAFMNALTPGYFKTLGVPILEGRDFDARDRGTDNNVIIVSRQFAEHYFPKQSALGRHVGFGTRPGTKLTMEIVGVVENTLYEGPRQGQRRQAYVSIGQGRFPSAATWYVRTTLPTDTIMSSIRKTVASHDASLPLYQVKTLAGQLDETLSSERLIASLSSAFGMLATLLAALGLYGVMSFLVSARTKEIGLRMALGAQPNSVLWLVGKEAATVVIAGILIGAPLAYYLSQYVASQLFEVNPIDWVAAAAAATVLAATGFVAGFLPAKRASSIDPIRALHYE